MPHPVLRTATRGAEPQKDGAIAPDHGARMRLGAPTIDYSNNNNNNNTLSSSWRTIVVHTVQVTAPCQGVTACRTNAHIVASEIVASPIVLRQLLEPLQNTSEAALIVRYSAAAASHTLHTNTTTTATANSTVSASSFHPTVTTTTKRSTGSPQETNRHHIWLGPQASLLKSETSVSADEFLEFDFVSNRDILDDLPEEVNREVILVFSLKECRAVLQFLGSLEEVMATLTFHWGGQPVTIQADQQSWSINLVLATLDYKLLTSLRTTE